MTTITLHSYPSHFVFREHDNQATRWGTIAIYSTVIIVIIIINIINITNWDSAKQKGFFFSLKSLPCPNYFLRFYYVPILTLSPSATTVHLRPFHITMEFPYSISISLFSLLPIEYTPYRRMTKFQYFFPVFKLVLRTCRTCIKGHARMISTT